MSQMWYGTQVIMMYVIYISGHKEHHSSSSYSDDATKIHVWLPSLFGEIIRMRRWKDSVPLVVNIIMVISASCYELSSNGFIQLYRTV